MADILAVQIKEEPLDEEEVVCMLGQAAGYENKQGLKNFPLSNTKTNLCNALIKTDYELADVITVDVSTLKGDNERKFMEKLTLSTQTKTCTKCQHIFYTNDEYERHLVANMCTKAPNIFPCGKLCGRYFKTAEECRLHEEEDHAICEKNIQINSHEKTPPKRYKLKSQFLKKPEPLQIANNPIENLSTVIKEEPKTPPPELCVPFETNFKIKEEPIDESTLNIPMEMITPEVNIKTEPEELWPNNLGIKMPTNLNVVSLPQNAFNSTSNGMLQVQCLPKNMKIVKIDKLPNIVTISNMNANMTPFPVNIVPPNNINVQNTAMLVKLETVLPPNTKIQQIVKPQVLKPANQNNTTFPLNGGQFKVTMPFQRSYTVKKEDNRTKEEISNQKLQEARDRVRKIQVESKVKLRQMEMLPQKRKVIAEMLQQIKMAQELKPSPKTISTSSPEIIQNSFHAMNVDNISNQNSISTENLSTDSAQCSAENDVKLQIKSENAANETVNLPNLILPLMTTFDQEINSFEKLHPEFRFSWVCPKCPRLYEIKRAARNHLVARHEMTQEDLQNMKIEYRGFPIADKFPKKPERKSADKKRKTTSVQDEDSSGELQTDIAGAAKKRKTHTCTRCGRIFSGSGVLRDHLRANCSREPQYPCSHCPKSFYSASTLNCHLTIHTGELPHKCNFCDKRFRTRGQVTVHHRTHTGERPFVCQVCNQAFTHRETLIAHLSRHIGMKRYKCYGCNKHFSCISGLKTHRDKRPDTCAKVKFNPRAVGPRVRVVRGNVLFEPQPEINPYLRTEDPPEVLAEIQNQT